MIIDKNHLVGKGRDDLFLSSIQREITPILINSYMTRIPRS